MSKNILVTGSAGFIGFFLCKQLIEDRYKVIGIDNINDYYDTKLKKKRLEILSETSLKKNNWEFFKIDLLDKNGNLIKKDNDTIEDNNFIFNILSGLKYENKTSVSELINPINFFIWIVVSFKDIF